MGDRVIALPVVGVFEIDNGRIRAWRDYFDMGQFRRHLNARPTLAGRLAAVSIKSLRATVVDSNVNQMSGAPAELLLLDDDAEAAVRGRATYIVRPLRWVVTWRMAGGPRGCSRWSTG
jgi:hypothetical protein